MTRAHLVNMGHKVPKIPAYQTAKGAASALRKAGFDNLEQLFDSILPRIAPAAALPGDIVLMQGDSLFDAATISVGGKVFGFFEGQETPQMIVPLEVKAAWRA